MSNLAYAAPKPDTKKFSNGDVAIVTGNDQVTIMNAKGEITQQSTFSCSSFSETKAQLARMQKDLGNVGTFLHHDISYPLRWNHQGKHTVFKSAKQLEPYFLRVFSVNIQTVMRAQDPYLLFANANGTMIGDGQVWFCNTGIFAVNS